MMSARLHDSEASTLKRIVAVAVVVVTIAGLCAVLVIGTVGCPYVGAQTAAGPWWADALLTAITAFTLLAVVGTLGAPIAALVVLVLAVRVRWFWLLAIAAAPLISILGMWALVEFEVRDIFRPFDVDWRDCGDAL